MFQNSLFLSPIPKPKKFTAKVQAKVARAAVATAKRAHHGVFLLKKNLLKIKLLLLSQANNLPGFKVVL